MSQLKKGVLLSYTTIVLTNVIGLVLTPFIIRSLGDAEYGLYALLGAFVGYISVLDLGLNNTIVRYVAKYRAEKDKEGEESFLSTTMLIYGVISFVVALLGGLLYFNLESIFGESLTSRELEKARIMFIILIFNVAITLPGGAFTAICNGYEHFVYPRIVNIIRYVVRSGAVVGLLMIGGDAIGLVLIDSVLNIVIIIINAFYVFNKLHVRFRLFFFKRNLIKEVFSYSIWIFILTMVAQFQWNGGQVLLGIKTDTTTVAVYAVGILLGTYYGAFASAISGVFLPRATQMAVNKSNGRQLTETSIKIGRLTLIVLLGILGSFYLFGQQFILLWVGELYAAAWAIALLIMVTSTNILVQSFADSTLKARKLFKFKGLTYISLIMFGTFLGYHLIDQLGGLGMIIGICTSWSLSQILVTYYFHHKLGFEIFKFYRELFRGIVPVFLVTLFFGFLVNYFLQYPSWSGFFLKVSIFLFFYCLLMLILGANLYEKSLLPVLVKNKLRIR